MYENEGGIFKGAKSQVLAAIFGTLLSISDGMVYGWTSPMIPYLISERSHIKTTMNEAQWLETSLIVGSVVGLPLTIYLVDKLGRKRSLLLAAFLSLLCWIAIAVATSMVVLFVARFIFGITANTAFVSAPMYIAEIADHKIRGFLSSVIYINMIVGLILVYSIGPYLPFYVSPVVGSLILILGLSVFSFKPETPYYLIYKGKKLEGGKSLEFFRPDKDIDQELSDIVNSVTRQKSEKGRWLDLFVMEGNRKALIIMSVLNAGQHLSGITVILMNLHVILEAAGSIYLDSSIAAIIFAVIMLFAAYLSSLQVDKYGRRCLLMVSLIATAVCLAALTIYFHLKFLGYDVRSVSWLPIVAVMFYAAAFKMGIGIIPIVLTAELFPTNIKAIGMALAELTFLVGSIISLQLYQWLGSLYGLYVPFYVFTACSIIVCLFTYFYIPETKGKTLEEIQYLLRGGNISKTDSLASLLSEYSKPYNTFDTN